VILRWSSPTVSFCAEGAPGRFRELTLLLEEEFYKKFSPDKIAERLDKAVDEAHKYSAENDTEVPEMFLDPIMFVPIKTPIVLPDTKHIMEKNIIIQQLYKNQKHPFTMKELSIRDLEEFNKTKEAISILDKYRIEYDKWSSSR